MKDYYQLLGVSQGANTEEIKAAYERHPLHHDPAAAAPGTHGAEMAQLKEALHTLTDPHKRPLYDKRLQAWRQEQENAVRSKPVYDRIAAILGKMEQDYMREPSLQMRRQMALLACQEALSQETLDQLSAYGNAKDSRLLLERVLGLLERLEPAERKVMKPQLSQLAGKDAAMNNLLYNEMGGHQRRRMVTWGVGGLVVLVVAICLTLVITKVGKQRTGPIGVPATASSPKPAPAYKKPELKERQLVDEERDREEERKMIQAGYVEHVQATGPLDACNGCINDSLKDGHVLTLKALPGANVIFTLIDYKTRGCVRKIYLKAGDTYVMRNLPEGYMVGRALYGKKLYRKDKRKGKCDFAFAYNALEKYTDLMLFQKNPVDGDTYRPPSTLELGVVNK